MVVFNRVLTSIHNLCISSCFHVCFIMAHNPLLWFIMVCYGFLLFMSVYVGLFHNWGYSPFTKWDVPPSRQSPAQPCLNLMEDQHGSLPLVRTFAGLGSKLGI